MPDTPVPTLQCDETSPETHSHEASAAYIDRLERHNRAMKRLVAAVQDLSLARTLDAVTAVVRKAARELTGADGATFVLRDNDKCFYADEDAIAPLWKGQRFPMSACVSGWVMLNKQHVIIEDIYADPRIPADAYRPTFVKSLAMVPIRAESPIGAIGNYWASPHRATPEEIEVLQALANTTAVAIEDVQLYAGLEHRVLERTLQLEQTNRELEAFSSSVSHDLRAPLRHIAGFAAVLVEDHAASLNEDARACLARIDAGVKHMGTLIDDMLRLAKVAQGELKSEDVDLSALASEVAAELKAANPGRAVDFKAEENRHVRGDKALLRVVLENLLSNAWKYTAKKERALIEFGSTAEADARNYFVRDNGAGFDMQYTSKLFAPFQRLHSQNDFPGHGVGLATIRRIVHRHGGRIWAQAEPEKGATFYFTLPPAGAPAMQRHGETN